MAVAAAILAVIALRIAGFAATSAAGRSDLAVVVVWILPVAAIAASLAYSFYGTRIQRRFGSLSQRLPELPRPWRGASGKTA